MRKRNDSLRKRLRVKYKALRLPCHICGGPVDYDAHHLDPQAFVLDHVEPFALGGADAPSNLKPAHRPRSCNRAKGIRTDGAGIVRHSGSLNIP